MNLLAHPCVRLWLVSATLLAAWGCEDDGNLGLVHVAITDAGKDMVSPDRSGSEAVSQDSSTDMPSPLPDGSPDVSSDTRAPNAAPDAIADMQVDVTGLDAGPAALAPDATPDVPSDNPPEGPADVTADAFCPGADCPLVIATDHLQVWLRGDDEMDCPFDGTVARVREWRDRSGKGNHAKPAGGQVGPLCGPSAGMLNGKRVVTFPRTLGQENGEHLQVSLASIQDRPFTVAIVEKRKDAIDFSSWLLGSRVEAPDQECVPNVEGANTARVLQIGYAAAWDKRATTWGHPCGIALDETVLTDAGPPDPTAPTVTTLWLVTLTADKKLSLHLNGSSRGESADEGLRSADMKPAVMGFIGRGLQPAPFDSRFKGDIAEILIYDVALDSQQRRLLEQYLQSRWGFVIAN
jgi:hypothetical protein